VARFLCAWEFGGDLGHVRRLIPIARELRVRGHEVSVAFRDSSYLHEAMREGIEAFVAPLLRAPREMSIAPLNFSDMLLNLGFEDPAGLAGALRAWGSLFALLRADVVVCDYAPTALLAARNAGLPRVTVGTGFSVPRAEDPLPALRHWAAADPNVLRALDDRLLAAIRKALEGSGAAPPAAARDILEANADLLCTFRELDPFAPREAGEYVGPQGDAATGLDIGWGDAPRPRVFAYLKPRSARFEAVLAGLRAMDVSAIVAAPGLAPERAAAASTRSLRVVPSTVNLERVLPGSDLCVAHGGPGLAARALVAGVPMALLPEHLEQYLVASRLAKGGGAALVSPEEAPPDFGQWLTQLLAHAPLREAAARHAEAHRGFSFDAATRLAADRIEQAAGA
jgi:UDP:flavonoid glycosyltransferase YjiC (YdhE family)